MRRKTLIIPLFAAAAMLTIGHLAGAKQYQKVSAEAVDYQTYVPVSSGWIENTDGSAETTVGAATRGRNDRFWTGNADTNDFNSQERTFNAMDDFIDTIHRANGGEGWRGAYRTPELVLHDNEHRYVSFLFGGGGDDIFINIFQVSGAAGSGDRIAGIRTALDKTGSFDDNKGKSDAEKLNAPISCNMVFKYYELPNEIQPGDHFLIYVRDGRTGDYGGFTFGGIHINQTLSDVARSFSAHKAQMKLNEFTSPWNRNANEYVLNYYANDAYYASVRTAEAALTDADDDFEINNRLSNWAYDQANSTYENGNLAGINCNSIYSDKGWKWGSYFYDNNGMMPTNKEGNMFLTGEPDDSDGPNCGLPESAKYRLVSPEFELTGTGLISAKLGGHFAALQLLDSSYNVIATTGDVNPAYVAGDMTNIALSGARLNTMVRVYLDGGAYVGQRVHVALADTRTGGDWNLAYFDDVKTNYATNPIFKIEKFEQHSNTDTYSYGFILDKYVDNGHNSVFKEAYDFLQVYYASLRSPANEFSYASASFDNKADAINAYLNISSAAQTFAGTCKDVRYTTSFSENWFLSDEFDVDTYTVADEFVAAEAALVSANGTSTVSFSASGGSGSMSSLTILNGTKTSSLPCGFAAPNSTKKFQEWDEETISANVTLNAQWVDTAKTKIEEETTLSALRFYYQDNNIFRDVALRFGGFISQDLWDELETETTILGYGVIVSTSSSIQTRYEDALGETVDEKLDNLCDNVTTKKVSVSGNTPATANDDQENYMGVTGDYYVWQVRVNIGDKFTTNYSSVAYIKTSDGIIFLQEVTCSAKSLATSTLPKIGGSDPIRVPFQTMANWEAA